MIVFTNGCFDLIHEGHVSLLRFCRDYYDGGNLVVVGVNSDESVKQLKGPNRPICNQWSRLTVIQAIRYVWIAEIFDETDVSGLLLKFRPNVWVKGGDYTLETLNQKEVAAAKSIGCQIVIFPTVQGFSSTNLIEKMQIS